MKRWTVGLTVVVSLLTACRRDPPHAGAPQLALAAGPGAPGVAGEGRLPAPRHGGRVQLVGNYALETVAARAGGVALFWTNLDGTPVPASQVALPSVLVDVGGRPQTVPVRVVNGAHVARVTVPAAAPIVVTVPHVEVYGVVYEQVVVPSVVVVAALPGIIVVPAVAPVYIGVQGKHRKHRNFRGGFFIR